jgi:hypothetical protein
MLSSAAIGVKKIVPIREAPIPTKVDPTKVDIHEDIRDEDPALKGRDFKSRRESSTQMCTVPWKSGASAPRKRLA